MYRNHFTNGIICCCIFCAIIVLSACDSSTSWFDFDGKISPDEEIIIREIDSISFALDPNPQEVIAALQETVSDSKDKGFNKAAANALYQIALIKHRAFDAQSTLQYLNEAIELTDANDYELRALILDLMATSQSKIFEKETIDSLLLLVEQHASKTSSPRVMTALKNSAANRAVAQGDFFRALELFFELSLYYEEIADSTNLAIIYENIALNYRSIKNYEQAVRYLNKAVLINKKFEQSARLATNFNNLGVIFSESAQIDSAINAYYQALGYYRMLNTPGGLAMTHMNIANLQTKLDYFEKATMHYDSSLYYIEIMKSNYGRILYRINMGSLKSRMGNFKAAIPLLESALHDCIDNGMVTESVSVKKMLYEAWKGLGNHSAALEYFENFHHLNDSLRSLEVQTKMINLENDYEISRRELKLAQFEKSLAIAGVKARNKQFVIILLTFILIIAVGLLMVRKRHIKLQYQLAYQKLEKATLDLELKNKQLKDRDHELARLRKETAANGKPYDDVQQAQSQAISKALDISQLEYNKFEAEFELRYGRVLESFYVNLLQKYPDLTPSELRICGFLKMNMSSKEIAMLTNRSIRTIENTRNNIRIKMKLAAGTKVASWMMAFE